MPEPLPLDGPSLSQPGVPSHLSPTQLSGLTTNHQVTASLGREARDWQGQKTTPVKHGTQSIGMPRVSGLVRTDSVSPIVAPDDPLREFKATTGPSKPKRIEGRGRTRSDSTIARRAGTTAAAEFRKGGSVAGSKTERESRK